MNNRKEQIEFLIRHAGPQLDDDRTTLRNLIEQNPALQRMLHSVLIISDGCGNMLLGADFTTEVGVKNAIKIQAKAAAYSLVVEDIIEFVSTEQQPETKETENAE